MFFFSESHALNFIVYRLSESFQQKYRDIATYTSGVCYFKRFSFTWVGMDHKTLILYLLSWLNQLIISAEEKVDRGSEIQKQCQQRDLPCSIRWQSFLWSLPVISYVLPKAFTASYLLLSTVPSRTLQEEGHSEQGISARTGREVAR